MIFFATRATHSATKVALANTNIRFIHMLIITIALIGFELLETTIKLKDGLGGLRSLDL